jgi:hypothetical protein
MARKRDGWIEREMDGWKERWMARKRGGCWLEREMAG